MRLLGEASTLRRWGLVIAVLLGGTVSAAPGSAFGGMIADWEMNERPGATIMHDSGGFNLSGTIGSAVETGVVTEGAIGYRWPSENRWGSAHPERLIMVNGWRLNPGLRDFRVVVRFYTSSTGDQNIIQKGQARTIGGLWKIPLFGGKVGCNFKGSEHRSAVWSSEIVADNQWHTVRCTRRPTGVTISVDGGTPRTNPRWTGRIANTWPLAIGGKPKCDGTTVACDYFVGRIDRVLVKRLRPL
jgi:Laminin G domain